MPNRGIEAALLAFSPALRGFCPSRTELVAYFDSELAPDLRELVRAHLDACPFCAADLADLTALATPPVIEAVVAMIADGLRLVSHSFARSAQLALEPARGAATATAGTASTSPAAVDLTAPAEEGELHLQVRYNPASSPDLRVRLTGPTRRRVRISLYRGTALLESHVTEADEVVFPAVPPGHYRLSAAPLEGDELARVELTIEAEALPA